MAKRRAKEPRWVNAIVNVIGKAIQPIDPLGEIGFRLERTADEKGEFWQLSVYPRLNEIWGGPDDGKQAPPGFALCLSRLFKVFDVFPHVDWVSPRSFVGDLDGPHICLDGVYRDARLMLLVYDQPPQGDGISLVVNAFTGEVRDYEASDDESA